MTLGAQLAVISFKLKVARLASLDQNDLHIYHEQFSILVRPAWFGFAATQGVSGNGPYFNVHDLDITLKDQKEFCQHIRYCILRKFHAKVPKVKLMSQER